jgi:UDP:flavonoid glycosyltransferase YjiC (YdhE family)
LKLLENPKYRQAAQKIRETFIEAGGNDKAVQLLEDLLRFMELSTLIARLPKS